MLLSPTFISCFVISVAEVCRLAGRTLLPSSFVTLCCQASSLIYFGGGGGAPFWGLPEINSDVDKDLTATPHSISVWF